MHDGPAARARKRRDPLSDPSNKRGGQYHDMVPWNQIKTPQASGFRRIGQAAPAVKNMLATVYIRRVEE